MPKKNIKLFCMFAVSAVVFGLLDKYVTHFCMITEGRSLAAFFTVASAIAAGYELSVITISFLFRWEKRAPSEVGMVGGLFRAIAILTIAIVFIHFTGKLSGSLAAGASFAGLLMGWSLQAPVSGVAAWVLVNVKRPFRVGDRVMLPAWGLTGDVMQIGMMYTVLNQVGGTVGSEEAAGRNILIPNAMLFGNVVINYTPQQSAAYVLDEVVIRITYNSNWDAAEKILLDAATEVTGDIIQYTGQRPYIRADMYDYGVYMRLRYMTRATDRPRIVYEITRRIYEDFRKHAEVDFAIPYVFSHRTGMRAGARHLEAGGPVSTQSELDVDQIEDLTGVSAKPENAAQIQELAQKISEMGLLQPMVVEKRDDGKYNVVIGQLRLAACKMLGWKTVPCIVKPPR